MSQVLRGPSGTRGLIAGAVALLTGQPAAVVPELRQPHPLHRHRSAPQRQPVNPAALPVPILLSSESQCKAVSATYP